MLSIDKKTIGDLSEEETNQLREIACRLSSPGPGDDDVMDVFELMLGDRPLLWEFVLLVAKSDARRAAT